MENKPQSPTQPKKVPENIPGVFYVDDQCIACDACVIETPRFFAMNSDMGYAFVKKQPKNAAEMEECENALAACPVGAIGKNE